MSTAIVDPSSPEARQQLVRDIQQAFSVACQDILRLAVLVHRGLREYGLSFRDDICENTKLTKDAIRRLEQIGAGAWDHRLFLSTRRGLERMSITEQKQALDNGTEVLLADGDVMLVKYDNMTQEQARQVFAATHIRDIAEQRAWMESERNSRHMAIPLEASPVYQIRGKKLYVNRRISFTADELRRLLKQLEQEG